MNCGINHRSSNGLNTLDDVFNSLMQPVFAPTFAQPAAAAPLTVWHDPAAIHVEIDMPGVKMENVEVTMQRDLLHIKAKREWNLPEGAEVLRNDERTTELSRTIRIAETIDTEKVAARFESGVLKVTLPKRAEAQPRRINIVGSN